VAWRSDEQYYIQKSKLLQNNVSVPKFLFHMWSQVLNVGSYGSTTNVIFICNSIPHSWYHILVGCQRQFHEFFVWALLCTSRKIMNLNLCGRKETWILWGWFVVTTFPIRVLNRLPKSSGNLYPIRISRMYNSDKMNGIYRYTWCSKLRNTKFNDGNV
jgi:hypothetical protein